MALFVEHLLISQRVWFANGLRYRPTCGATLSNRPHAAPREPAEQDRKRHRAWYWVSYLARESRGSVHNSYPRHSVSDDSRNLGH